MYQLVVGSDRPYAGLGWAFKNPESNDGTRYYVQVRQEQHLPQLLEGLFPEWMPVRTSAVDIIEVPEFKVCIPLAGSFVVARTL